MSAEPFEDAAPHRPLWLMTLADLALLLLGFLVLVQATAPQQRAALAKGLRGGFGSVEQAEPIQVAANGITGFAQGSAVLPAGQAALTGWARDAVRDPRVRLIVTGSAGWNGDVDAATGSATILAVDRARSVAALLASIVPSGRMTITTATGPGPRGVSVAMAFTGALNGETKDRDE